MPYPDNENPARPWRPRLYLPAYSVQDAARYAQTTPQTVRSWYYGKSLLGPALTGKSKGDALSYLQLVEVAFVAAFRRLGVRLQRIRKAREYAAQRFQVEYPFSQLQFQTEGTHLLLELKQANIEPSMARVVVADAHGQMAWKDLVGDLFMQFDYEDDIAIKWHVRGREAPILIDPRVAFGAPLINGTPTWVIKGRWTAGEQLNDIREDFDLADDEIRQALEFEGIHVEANAA